MPLPMAPNVTFAVYRAGAVPPASPGATGLSGHLQAAFPAAFSVDRHVDAWQRFTHRLLTTIDVDVRDVFDGNAAAVGEPDSVFVPDGAGVRYRVVFVERRLRGTAFDHLCIYLSRLSS